MQKAHVVWGKKKSDGTFEHGAEFINIPKERILLLEDHIMDIKESLGINEKEG
jgi:hypothetical protein